MKSDRLAFLRPLATGAAGAALAFVAPALLALPPGAAAPPRKITVQTVEQLYEAVNSLANCGGAGDCRLTIYLAPGIYVLSGRSPGGSLRPNHGALRLRPGVSLVGSERHVDTDGDGVLDPIDPENADVFAVPGTETTIDGSRLDLPFEQRTDCAGEFRFFPDPVIYIGIHNKISSLSVIPGNHVGIGEPTNDRVDPNGSMSIEITDTVLNGVMTFANSECAARRARSVLTLTHSVVRNGFLLMQNFYTGNADDDPSDGPEIRATVAFNLFYDDGVALRAAAGDEGTDGGSLTLHMAGNVFRNNAANLQLRGAVGRDGLRAVGNHLVVTSDSDTFGEAPTSVFVVAGTLDALENRVRAEFFDSRFIRDSPDTPAEITIIGGLDDASGDHALIRIAGATVETSDGIPVEGGLSIADETGSGEKPSTARLEGSRKQFLLRNQGLPAPDEHFFVGR
jgi:hypothetical protein